MKSIWKTENKIKINNKNKYNGIDLLDNLKDNSVKVIFFDPQYRGVLNKLSYGNEGVSRGKNASFSLFELIYL